MESIQYFWNLKKEKNLKGLSLVVFPSFPVQWQEKDISIELSYNDAYNDCLHNQGNNLKAELIKHFV